METGAGTADAPPPTTGPGTGLTNGRSAEPGSDIVSLRRDGGQAELLILERANFPLGFEEHPTPNLLLTLFASGCPAATTP